jgi:molybdopterin-guanine dinucleotide biosynthesis protein
MDRYDRAGGTPAAAPQRPATRSQVSLALLAGGMSTRMGEDKAFVGFHDTTLLEWVRDRLAPLFAHTYIVTREIERFQGLGMAVVRDALEETGSVVGIYTAVMASPTERVVCVACDMPFVTPALVRALVERSAGFDVFVPRHGGRVEPLCAVYGKGCLDSYRQFIQGGGRRIFDVYGELATGYLELDDLRLGDPERLFANVNTPAELEAARKAGDDQGEGWRAALQPRIRAFMDLSPLPIVSFVGKKKSGKTTVLLGVVKELRSRGYRVALIKHDTHGFEIDVPGTDTYRFRELGTEVVAISSPDKYVWQNSVSIEPGLMELVRQVSEPVDLVITEGFKKEDAPKIEVSRRERSTELVSAVDELIGIASDQTFPGYPLPQLPLDDFSGLADLLERRILARV